jgi:hypothetical protein
MKSGVRSLPAARREQHSTHICCRPMRAAQPPNKQDTSLPLRTTQASDGILTRYSKAVPGSSDIIRVPIGDDTLHVASMRSNELVSH